MLLNPEHYGPGAAEGGVGYLCQITLLVVKDLPVCYELLEQRIINSIRGALDGNIVANPYIIFNKAVRAYIAVFAYPGLWQNHTELPYI